MLHAHINRIEDTNYKNGKVECLCGNVHPLGDGFNEYYVNNCPNCTPELNTREQKVVKFWDKGWDCPRKDTGRSVYYVLSNGIHVRHSFSGRSTRISERELMW